ncbi:hypothetical protein BGX34_003128 [Mortierella sp. NVP85]|nr:hypothetical protein BGX34_003128 [Mortierella sp. NVP85]
MCKQKVEFTAHGPQQHRAIYQPSALSQPAPHASKPTSAEAKPRYTAYYSGPWRPPPSPPAASMQPSAGSGLSLSKPPNIPVTGSLLQSASATAGGSKPATASSQMPSQALSLLASPATRTLSAPAAVAVQNTAPVVPEVANLTLKATSVPAPATSVSVASSSSSRPALSLGPAASASTEDWESNPIVTALLKKAVEVSTSRSMPEMTHLTSSPVAAPRIVPAVTSSPIVSAPNTISPKASVSAPPIIPSTTTSTINNIINTKQGISGVVPSSSAEAAVAGPSENRVIISTPKPMTSEPVQTLSVVPATAPVSSENTARATEHVSMVEKTTEINHPQPSPAAPRETTSMAPPAPSFPPPSNLSSPSAGKLRPVSEMNTRDRNDERLRALEKEVAWLLEYRGAPLTVSDHEVLSWSQQLKRFTSDVEDLYQKVDHNKRVTSKVSNLFDILNRAFGVHSSVMTETETRSQALRREDTATVSREMAQIREQALSQKLETEKIQRLLEANQRKETERAVAQAEYDLRVEKMLMMMETKLRTSAEEGMVRCQNELQEQRIQTLEKDLECRRSEALVMTAKANEEIKEAHLQVAKAREERAEAREHAARLELEREQLLKRIQELEAKRHEGPVGLATPTEVSSATSDSESLSAPREAGE